MSNPKRKLSKKGRQKRREMSTKPVIKQDIREEREPVKVFRYGRHMYKAEADKHRRLPSQETVDPGFFTRGTRTAPKCIECGEDGIIAISAGGKPIAYCQQHADELTSTPTGYEEFYNQGDYCVLPQHTSQFCQERYCKSCPTHTRYKVDLTHQSPPSTIPETLDNARSLLDRAKRL